MVTQEQLAQAILELKNSNLRLEASQEKTDKQMKETDRKLKSMGIHLGNISNNQGDIAEEFFYNSMKEKPSLAGIDYDFIDKNVTRSKNKIEDEYDILLVNGKDVAIIETKYKAHTSDVERLINKKYENFKKLYPEYKDYTHHLGLASFNMNEDVKEMASKNNVILIQRKGDLIETIMPSL
jgi:phage anti-repressor protein